ncbi:MAG: glycosyltransferase family 4 protein [Phycisphaerae bacterium]
MTPLALAVLLFAAAVATFFLSLLFTTIAIRVARRIGFVDRPGAHKSHRDPTPYGGGTAMLAASVSAVAGLLAGALLLPDDWLAQRFGETVRAYAGGLHDQQHTALAIVLGALAMHALGLVDDLRPLGAQPKLIALVAIGALVSWQGDVRIGEFAHPAISIGATTLWIVVIANAFNFLDNMDGLSAGVAAICIAGLVTCGVLAGQVLVPVMGCLFLGAIVGFLVFNFPPARIFMGDAGSLLSGFFVAVLAAMTTYYESGRETPPYALAMPLVVLAVPLYDFASVLTIRWREGRRLMQGDQRHFSHRLVERGLSRKAAVVTIYLATAATGLSATLLPGADLRQTLTIGAVVVLVLTIVAILESPVRRAP